MDTIPTNDSKCRIVVDAMGGDFSPLNAIVGSIQAYEESGEFELYLVGQTDEIKNVISSNNLSFDNNKILHADEVIEMGEKPTQALKQKLNSSIVVGAKFIRDGNADAFVSAGNTGAVMAASTLIIGRISGVGRPTISVSMPNETGICNLFDVGASVDSKPRHLLEYAIMGSIYTEEINGIKNPTVGILNVGEEEGKGNELTVAASELIKKTNLNFVGNVEGNDIFKGTANVIVCDGFIGNILIKFGEGVLSLLKHRFKDYASQSLTNKIKVGLIRSTMREAMKDFDYQTHGGAPLLGINKISIIGHGSSTPKAIKNMVLRANEMHKKKLIEKISKSITQYSNLK